MRSALVALLLTCCLSCSAPPAGSGALRVDVTVEGALSSRCFRVVARGDTERQTPPIALDGGSSYRVAVFQAGEPLEVEVQALGFSDEGCTALSEPPERSEPAAARFGNPPPQVSLALRRAAADGGTDAGADLDGDGYPAGVDCDDADPAVHPGATESCANGRDDDCDGFADCAAQGVCGGQSCRPGGGAACASGACVELACADLLDNDGDGAADCADPDCAGQACGTNGLCQGLQCVAPTEAGLCADGVDNDLDGQVDCADSDCPAGAACSDQNACTLTDTCAAGACQAGAPVSCTTPPATQCFAPAGACLPDAGGACSYAVQPGPCDDGRACTELDACGADGGCAGTPKSCATPPGACFQATGTCAEPSGTCSYLPSPTGGCDDGDNCTVSDSCDGDGGCVGTRVSCLPPSECLTSSTCTDAGACIFVPRSGACDGGSCDGTGACVPTPALFGYLPSNFTEAQLPASAGAVVLNCNLAIDTLAADGGVSFTTCPTGITSLPARIVPVGAGSAALLFMDSLTINSGVTLRAVGARPLILAVAGGVTVSGTVDVGSATLPGAGSDLDCATGAGLDGGASGSPQTAGGGGGGAFLTNGSSASNGANGGPAGASGMANGSATLEPLRGGCRGGNGGRGNGTPALGGLGGRGGGAVQISAGGAITINSGGTVAAPGGGGQGGLVDQRVGGGGGGSGGAILLEASTLTVNAGGAVVANGGAGGEGSGYGGAPWSGVDGQDGLRATTRAQCLSAGACGGNGGAGGARSGNPTNAGGPECSTNMPGGGGGGSAGRLRFRAGGGCTLSGTAIISPAQTGVGPNCN